jgi:hypothetical protein
MINLELKLSEQIKIFKEDVITLYRDHGIDISKPIKIIDLYTLEHLIDDYYEITIGEKVAKFVGYQKHPYKKMDIDKILKCLEQEEQIKMGPELKKPEKIVKCEMPGSRDFKIMLEENINKTFIIQPNFNMPPSDSNHLIQQSIFSELPKQLLPTILEINKAYLNGLNIACGILLRRLLEGSIILKYTQLNKLDEIKYDNGDYLGLQKMINKVFTEGTIAFHKTLKTKVNSIKWLGDKGAHNFDLEIFRTDIQVNLATVKDFLVAIKLK